MHKRIYAALTAVLLAGAAGLGGCVATGGGVAPGAADTAPATSSVVQLADLAPRIAVPRVNIGQWYDLGAYRAPWLASDGPVPAAGPVVPTRVAGWLREADPKDKASQDEWLAIVIVQAAPGGSAPCAEQASSLTVTDTGGAGCLRLRRNADFDHWMQAAQPALYRWVDDHGWTSLPRAWASYRVPSANGRAIEVHALFAPSLIEPTTRNPVDFITSGVPGQKWARQLAAAARALDGTANNAFAVPPFPFAPGPRAELEATLPDVLPTKSETAASAPAPSAAPAVAEQVMPAPPPEEYAPRRRK